MWCSPTGMRSPAWHESTSHQRNICAFQHRYYTTVLLACKLLDQGIHLTGTAKTDAKYWPKAIMSLPKTGKVAEGELRCAMALIPGKGSITTLQWQDRKLVPFITTLPVSLVNETKDRRSKGTKVRRQIHRLKPSIISMYNAKMGGVDRCDQIMSRIRPLMRKRRWQSWYVFL